MPHKIVNLKKGFAYTGTIVHFNRSLTQIHELLMKFRCDKIAVLTDQSGDLPLYTLAFQKAGLSYIIEFPITYVESLKGKTNQLNMDVSGRIIHDRIKSLLIDVEIGYLDFSQAMMGYIALPGPDNRPISLMEYTTTHQSQIQSGRIDFSHMLPGGSRDTNTEES